MNASQCTTTMNGLRSTTGIYGFHELKPQLFPEDEELSAKRRVNLTRTLVELKRLFT